MDPRYKTVQPLGAGGYGIIEVVEDQQTRRKYVRKSLRCNSPENGVRLSREASMLHLLRGNQFVVRLLDYDLQSPRPYLILEYCAKGTLRLWVTQRHNWYDVSAALIHVALALKDTHALGGFHRDVKPDNLFITQADTGELVVKLGDFGLGRLPLTSAPGNMTRSPYGTPGYIAPELYCGRPYTATADIYSMGITGIEMLTGSIERDSIQGMWWVPSSLRNLLLSMTRLDPNERPDIEQVENTLRESIRSYDRGFAAAVGIAAFAVLGVFLLAKTK